MRLSGLRSCSLLLVFAAGLAVPAVAAPSRPKPSLFIEPGAVGHQISVQVPGGARVSLRSAPGLALPGASGWDPAGRAAFVTWNEGGERWFSASRDGGATWMEARAIDTALRFLRVTGAVEEGWVDAAFALDGGDELPGAEDEEDGWEDEEAEDLDEGGEEAGLEEDDDEEDAPHVAEPGVAPGQGPRPSSAVSIT